MRVLMAMVIFAGSVLASGATAAEPVRKLKRTAKSQQTTQLPRTYTREEVECERAQHEDPAGVYAAYPCWARETFGRGNRGIGGDNWE